MLLMLLLMLFPLLLLMSFVPAVHAVSLQSGAHLDLNVVVMVQKAFTRDGCNELEQLDNVCLRRKCTQNMLYKVDLGYSKVRKTVDGRPFDYPEGKDAYVANKNRISRQLANKVAQMNNDAFQPFLFAEFERLIGQFFDGHAKILALFNFTMEELVNEQLSLANWTTADHGSTCADMPGFAYIEKELVEMLEENWSINWTRHTDNVTDVTFFETIKHRIPPSPIQMIEAYNMVDRKEALINHTNHLYRLLVRLSNESRPFRPTVGQNCRALLEEADAIVKPLVSRLHYSPVRSLFVRDLEAVLSTKSARGQLGTYSENNMASIRFRFMSMTAVRMEEEYNNFNLLVDLGSTLGLYFGLTILTLFELLIFLLYRTGSHDPLELQKLPSQSVIYNIPPASKRTTRGNNQTKLLTSNDGRRRINADARQRRKKQIDGHDEDDKYFVNPVIF